VNWVDISVIAVLVFSGLLGMMRGFAKEVLSVAAWAGALVVALWAGPSATPSLQQWITNPDIAAPAAYALVFVVALIFFSVVGGIVGNVIADSVLGGLDRTLGIVFGIVRGALIVSAGYILLAKVKPPEQWPAPLVEARSLPIIYEGAVRLASFAPAGWAITVPPPPAATTPGTNALLSPQPEGRATGVP